VAMQLSGWVLQAAGLWPACRFAADDGRPPGRPGPGHRRAGHGVRRCTGRHSKCHCPDRQCAAGAYSLPWAIMGLLNAAISRRSTTQPAGGHGPDPGPRLITSLLVLSGGMIEDPAGPPKSRALRTAQPLPGACLSPAPCSCCPDGFSRGAGQAGFVAEMVIYRAASPSTADPTLGCLLLPGSSLRFKPCGCSFGWGFVRPRPTPWRITAEPAWQEPGSRP